MNDDPNSGQSGAGTNRENYLINYFTHKL